MEKETLSSKILNRGDQSEGQFTKAIEEQTSKIPSAAYLAVAGGAIALSLGLFATQERKSIANFVGMWAPTFLLLGLYNKLVKLEGSDRFNRPELH